MGAKLHSTQDYPYDSRPGISFVVVCALAFDFDFVLDLMMETPDASTKYIVRGLGKHISFKDLAVLCKESMRWNVKPLGYAKSDNRNKISITVHAKAPPKEMYVCDGDTWVQIVKFDTKIANRPTIWTKAFEEHKNTDGFTYSQATRGDDA